MPYGHSNEHCIFYAAGGQHSAQQPHSSYPQGQHGGMLTQQGVTSWYNKEDNMGNPGRDNNWAKGTAERRDTNC